MYLNPAGTNAGDFSTVEPYEFGLLNEDVKAISVADLDGDVRRVGITAR